MLCFAAEQKYGAVGEGSVMCDKRDGEEMEGPLNKPIPLPPFLRSRGILC